MRAFYYPEATEGTAVGSVTYLNISQHTEFEITYSAEPVVVTLSGGYDPTATGLGKHMANVKIKGAVGPDFKTFIITYGSTNTAVTVVLSNGTQFYTIVGCKVKSWKLQATGAAEGGTPLNYELEFEGWTVTMTSPSSFTPDSTTAGFSNWSDVTMTVGGSTIVPRSFEINVENALDDDFGATGARTAILRGPRKHEGKFSYTSPTSVTDFTTLGANTAKTVVISVTGLIVTATSASFTEVSEKIPNDKIVVRSVSWTNGGALTVAAS